MARGRALRGRQQAAEHEAEVAALADALALVRGLLVAGLNPHVARKDREAPDASLRCKGNQRWWVHPQSVNFELLGGRGDARAPVPAEMVESRRRAVGERRCGGAARLSLTSCS